MLQWISSNDVCQSQYNVTFCKCLSISDTRSRKPEYQVCRLSPSVEQCSVEQVLVEQVVAVVAAAVVSAVLAVVVSALLRLWLHCARSAAVVVAVVSRSTGWRLLWA